EARRAERGRARAHRRHRAGGPVDAPRHRCHAEVQARRRHQVGRDPSTDQPGEFGRGDALMLAALLAAVVTMTQFQVLQPFDRERVLITGATGEGKSTYVHEFIDPLWRKAIFDPEGEYTRYRWMY